MPIFPENPVNGDSYDRYIYYDPPGVWRVFTSDSGSFDTSVLDAKIENLRDDMTNKVDKDDLDNIDTGENRRRVQQVALTAGVNTISLLDGLNIHCVNTDGDASIDLVDIPSGAVTAILSIDVKNNNDEVTVVNAVHQDGVGPPENEWNANDQMVFRLTRTPFVNTWVMEHLLDQQIAGVVVPTLTALHSQALGQNWYPLEAATLPPGIATIDFGPNDPVIASMRVFCNHTGGIPTEGSEGDSYVSKLTSPPWYIFGGETGSPVPWDTNFDPTGNSRESYDENGETTFTVEATLIDGQTTNATFTFNTSNAPVGSTPDITETVVAFANATSSTLVSIPNAVDRVVCVQAYYKTTSSSQNLTGLTLGGNSLTNIPAASYRNSQLSGSWAGYITENDLSTGDLSLVPSFDITPGAASAIIYCVWVITNLNTPTFVGDYDYANVAAGVVSTPTPSIPSVPANSILLTSASQENPDGPELTCDIGTPGLTAEISGKFESRSTHIADSGASATKSATWTTDGRTFATLMYVDYAASTGGEGGETPIIPAVPVISSTVAGDNKLTVTWNNATDAISYELRYGTSNPPAMSPSISSSPRVITGLASDVLYYVQVRSVSSTGDRSAWSTADSGTPTGVIIPPVEPTDKMLTANNAFDVSYIEGRARYDYPDMKVQNAIYRRNPGSTEYAMKNLAQNDWLDDAITLYNREKGNSAFVNQMGPRMVVSMKLSPLGLGNSNAVSTPAESAAMVLDMGKTGSTASNGINRDDTLKALASQINRTYNGYDVKKIVQLSIAHETNGPWSHSGYMGLNPNLIGRLELKNAKDSDYGSAMGAALRKAGTTGECSSVHRLACEHVMDVLWNSNEGHPDIIIGMTPSDGEDSIPPDQPPSQIGNTWVLDAFPRPELGWQLDFLCPTIYARMPGDVSYNGSGSVDVASNWSRGDGWLEYADEYVQAHACAFGFLEVGVSYAVPGYGLVADNVSAPSDEANTAFYEHLFNTELTTSRISSVTGEARFPQGFAFVNHWTKLRWQGKAPNNGKGSYVLNEGQWGEFTEPDVPTSNNKPSWSTVSTPGYLKTRDWFRANYPR